MRARSRPTPTSSGLFPGDQWRVSGIDADAGRAVREYLATLDDAAFGAASEGEAEVYLTVGSGGVVNRRPQGARLLRLRH